MCQKSHGTLKGTREDIGAGSSGGYCDQRARHGWTPGVWTSFGSRMIPEKSPGINHCGTSASGWLNGKHPTAADGVVSRTLCYHYSSSNCQWKSTIQVANCGSYYLYNIPKPSACSLGFCTTKSNASRAALCPRAALRSSFVLRYSYSVILGCLVLVLILSSNCTQF